MTAPHIEPQDGANDLVPHPHRYIFRGHPGDLQFPALCPHCGDAARETLGYTKVFRRTSSDSPAQYVLSSVRVPFCAACIARHRREEVVQTPLQRWLTAALQVDMLGAIFPAIAFVFVLWLVLGDVFHGRFLRGLVELAVAAFFGAIAWVQYRAVWDQSERLRVVPQTDVTKSFDFSDHDAPVFETARYTCTVRDARFAQALEPLNQARLWVPGSPEVRAEQQRANRKTWVIVAVVVVVLIVGWIFER